MEVSRKIHLARVIAASIDQVLPHGFHCHADEDAITIDEADGLWTSTLFGDILDGNGEDIARATEAVLNRVQTFVIEGKDFRGDSWPGPREAQQAPDPGTTVTNGTLEMWYGERDAPTLTLTRVPL